MIDIRISVRCPDLVQAAGTLAAAFGGSRAPQEAPQPTEVPAPTPAPTAQPVPTVTHQVTTGGPLPENVVQITTTTPTVELPPELTQSRAPVAPTAAPSYTAQDIARAGAMLIQSNPGIQPQLQALLQQFGVRAAMDLTPEQLPAFANALRGLGAKL